jgi:hypothetical protein
MIPVNIKFAVLIKQCIILHGSGGHTLQLPADVSPQWLGELLKCLDRLQAMGKIWSISLFFYDLESKLENNK